MTATFRRFGLPALLGIAVLALVGIRVASLFARTPTVAAATPPKPVAARPVPAHATDQRFVVKRILDIPGPIRIGDYYWDDAGVPAGPIVITVDLEAGVLSAFRDGYEIGTAAILYGADEMPTPLGVFPILSKDAHHFSATYNHAPMPYTLRLTPDGVSVHGSPEMSPKWATHGCVGLPVAFAKKLFDQAQVGDKVIITSGKRMNRGDRIIAA
jgi:lipoprotein-anchoring transpeptidase ErfK/SrfK